MPSPRSQIDASYFYKKTSSKNWCFCALGHNSDSQRLTKSAVNVDIRTFSLSKCKFDCFDHDLSRKIYTRAVRFA